MFLEAWHSQEGLSGKECLEGVHFSMVATFTLNHITKEDFSQTNKQAQGIERI